MPEPTYPVPFFAPGQKSLGRVRNSEDLTWSKLVSKCMAPALVGAPAGATDGELNVLKAEAGAWSPGAVFLENKRSRAALLTRSILAIDCDGPLPEDALDTADILGWSAVAHTTYKSTPDAPRWRVMLPLDQPVDERDYATCTHVAARLLGITTEVGYDPGSDQAERVMYRPASQRVDWYQHDEVNASPVPVDMLLAAAEESEKGRASRARAKGGAAPDDSGEEDFVIPLPSYDTLGEDDRRKADADVERIRSQWQSRAQQIKDWPDGERDDDGGGWESISRDAAWALSRLAVAPWNMYSWDEAVDDFNEWYEFAASDPAIGNKMAQITPREVEEKSEQLPVFHPAAKAEVEYKANGQEKDALAGDDPKWLKSLKRDDKGNLLKVQDNLEAVFRNDRDLRHLATNSMGGDHCWQRQPKWKVKASKTDVKDARSLVDDADLSYIRGRVREYYGGGFSSVPKDAIDDAMARYCAERTFHPWKAYLESLPEWDGVERVPHAIPDLKGDPEYTRQALLNWFLSGVSRAYKPGSKVDTMLVLLGKQGTRKTTWFQVMAPTVDMYYSLSAVPNNSGNKDLIASCHRACLVVVDELDQLLKGLKSQSEMKDFITQTHDTWRPPYARKDYSVSRSFILGGTTNESQFLMDQTGNRRYNILELSGSIPGDRLTADWRDMLWAEARDRYLRGERLDWSDRFVRLASAAASAHVSDPLGEAFREWLSDDMILCNKDRVAVNHIVRNAGDHKAFQGTEWGAANGAKAREMRKVLDNLPRWRRGAINSTIDGVQYGTVWVREEEEEEEDAEVLL